MLKQRVITALLLGALLVWLLFFQGVLAWQGFLLLAGGLAAEEWAALAGCRRAVRIAFALSTTVLAAVLLAAPAWLADSERLLLFATLGFWLLAVPVWLLRGWRVPAGPRLLPIGWLVILSTLLALSRLRQAGVGVLLAAMALIWVSDISAYFAGRAFGHHRLAPAISPGKTWEGVAGALAGVLLFVALLALLARADTPLAQLRAAAGVSWWPLAAVLAALGIEGDLFESWLKRCAGVKDSGWILPGHGGVLDRIDALTAALPAAALLFEYAAGSPMP